LGARLSSDGKWIAYVTDRSGREEVWITDFPDGTTSTQVSIDGGRSPAWGPNGRELFYVSKGRLMAATVSVSRSGVSTSKPRALFNVPNVVENRLMPTTNSFAVSPDGNRFLVAVRARDPNAPPIRIVADWRALLKR
jgi:Tol biopolymer transport system component